MYCCIRVGTPDGLLKCTKYIIVIVAVSVEGKAAFLRNSRNRIGINYDFFIQRHG